MAWQNDESGDLFVIEANEPVAYSSPAAQSLFSPSAVHFRKAKEKRGVNGTNTTNSKVNSEQSYGRNKLERLIFDDVSIGLKREVTVFVDPFKPLNSRSCSRCEHLFGIIPGRFALNGDDYEDDRIMVMGLVPDEVAVTAGVNIGETLKIYHKNNSIHTLCSSLLLLFGSVCLCWVAFCFDVIYNLRLRGFRRMVDVRQRSRSDYC